MEKKKRDYRARLVIYNLPELSSKELKETQEWLDKMTKEIKDNLNYSSRFVAKLMK